MTSIWSDQWDGLSRHVARAEERKSVPTSAQSAWDEAEMKRQQILDWMRESGVEPWVSLIARRFDLSKSTAQSYITRLAERREIVPVSSYPRKWKIADRKGRNES